MLLSPVIFWLVLAPAAEREQIARGLIAEIARSGRVLQLAEPPSERLAPPQPLAPGLPPLLSFRYFEGKDRHRFGKLDLVTDDAGH